MDQVRDDLALLQVLVPRIPYPGDRSRLPATLDEALDLGPNLEAELFADAIVAVFGGENDPSVVQLDQIRDTVARLFVRVPQPNLVF